MHYPIYHKYFTLDEIIRIVEFYKTPVGKKMVNLMPEMMQESIQAGEQWAQSLQSKFQQHFRARLREEGIEIKK